MIVKRVLDRWIAGILRRLSGGTVTRVQTSEPAVALTFDDGPDPDGTPGLLKTLEKHCARATFFMVGAAAVKHREIAEQVSRAGHAIGNHTWDHPSLPLISPRERRRQLRACARALDGYRVRLFRPPYGHLNCASHLDARMNGYEVIAWDVVVADWLDEDAAELGQRALKRIRPGSIVVLHDGLFDFLEVKYRNREKTVRIVEEILVELGSRYRFVTVPELMRCGTPVRVNWFMKPDLDLLNRLQRQAGEPRRYSAQRTPWLGYNR